MNVESDTSRPVPVSNFKLPPLVGGHLAEVESSTRSLQELEATGEPGGSVTVLEAGVQLCTLQDFVCWFFS